MREFLNKLHYIFIEVHINEWYLNLLQLVTFTVLAIATVTAGIYLWFFGSVIIKDLRLKTGKKK